MRIVMIAENDPAGVGSLLRNALHRHTCHTCRLVTTQVRYNHNYEKDLHVPLLDAAGIDELAWVLGEADVFHFHMLADEHMPLGPFTAAEFLHGKSIVHHHHGHHVFRANPELFQKKYHAANRKNLLVSTPDLLHKLPGAQWQPNLVPQRAPAYRPNPRKPDGRVRLGHSPTRKDLKNTAELLRVVTRLGKTLHNLELDMIDDASHADCLSRKQRCDVVFDHMQGYYGMASLESLAQGTPVVAGLDEWNIGRIREYFQCDALPWVLAHTATDLERVLLDLAQDDSKRHSIGADSRKFMETIWTEERLTADLDAFYSDLQ